MSKPNEAIHSQKPAFVTSRGFVLPSSGDEFASMVWFNMWQRRQWPYKELEVGDTLYWYDATPHVQAIVWKSTVNDADRFEYPSKKHVRNRFQERFGNDPTSDPYFIDAPDHGYCLAYKVMPVERLRLSKPADYRFPQGGWLRCNDEAARPWLSLLATFAEDGKFTTQLRQTASQVKDEGYFESRNVEDERKRHLREIVQRRGQPEFRAKLIDAYGGRCAVTGGDAKQALEAAHITPYMGPSSNHVVNGILLRADIHTLFDLDLLGVDPTTLTVVVSKQLRGSTYEELDGRALRCPANPEQHPSAGALRRRWEQFQSEP